jgi:hypothetical protein
MENGSLRVSQEKFPSSFPGTSLYLSIVYPSLGIRIVEGERLPCFFRQPQPRGQKGETMKKLIEKSSVWITTSLFLLIAIGYLLAFIPFVPAMVEVNKAYWEVPTEQKVNNLLVWSPEQIEGEEYRGYICTHWNYMGLPEDVLDVLSPYEKPSYCE